MKIVSGKSEHSSGSKRSSGTKKAPARPGGAASGAKPANSRPGKAGSAAPAPKQKMSGGKKAVLTICIVLAVLIAGFAGVGLYAGGIETIYPNVSMEGVALGGMTEAEAADALVEAKVGVESDSILAVTLPGNVSMKISKKEAGYYLSAPDAAVFAYNYCHNNGFFGNTIAFFSSLLGEKALTFADAASPNEEYLRSELTKAAQEVSLALMDTDVEIAEDSVNVVKGASGVTVDEGSLYTALTKALEDGGDSLDYSATKETMGSGQIDLQKLYDTVYTEPVNAYVDSETGQVVEGVDGLSFDVAGAQSLWDAAGNGETVAIPLIKTPPEITAESLKSTMFSELLSQKSTALGGSSAARVNNITKAAAAIDGTVLNPGEEFSYNAALGQRTTASGYQAAGAYSNGQVVSEVGGGICQVSSTLYYCTLIANMKITERWCHYFGVSYLPAGLDATVSWPSPDFKFKNSSEYPIKIAAYIDKNSYSVAVQIWGYNPDGIRVEMTTESFSTANGFGATSYRTVYDRNGSVISKTKEATSEYHYHTKPSPSPSASAEPSESPTTEPTTSPTPTTEPTPTPETPVTPAPTPTPTAVPQTPPPDVSVPPDA